MPQTCRHAAAAPRANLLSKLITMAIIVSAIIVIIRAMISSKRHKIIMSWRNCSSYPWRILASKRQISATMPSLHRYLSSSMKKWFRHYANNCQRTISQNLMLNQSKRLWSKAQKLKALHLRKQELQDNLTALLTLISKRSSMQKLNQSIPSLLLAKPILTSQLYLQRPILMLLLMSILSVLSPKRQRLSA